MFCFLFCYLDGMWWEMLLMMLSMLMSGVGWIGMLLVWL